MSDPTIPDEDGPEVIGTRETVKGLGRMGKRVAEIAGVDTVVVSRQDFADAPNGRTAIKKLRDIFRKAGMRNMAREELKFMVQSAMEGNPQADSFDLDGDGKQDIGLIIAPAHNITKREALSLMTGIPVEKLNNEIVGKDGDYFAAIMMHEAQHVSQPILHEDDALLPREADADRRAFRELKADEEKGLVSIGVREAILEARVIGGLHISAISMVRNILDLKLNDMFGTHSTHLLLKNAEGALPLDPTTDTSVIMGVNSYLNAAVQGYVIEEAILEVQNLGKGGKKAHVADPIFADGKQAMNALMSNRESSMIAEQCVQSNPAITHAALVQLREKGYIKDGTPEGDYVNKVLGFFEKHVNLDRESPQTRAAEAFFKKIPQADSLAEFKNNTIEGEKAHDAPGIKAGPDLMP